MEWSWKKINAYENRPLRNLSELAKSPTGAVYKANDPESGQTIALKAIQLSAFGESAAALEQALWPRLRAPRFSAIPTSPTYLARAKSRASSAPPWNTCRATASPRCWRAKKDFPSGTFSTSDGSCAAASSTPSRTISFTTVWSRPKSCAAGTARSEFWGSAFPASATSLQHVTEGIPSVLYYMSPEQVQGQATDVRSNLFSLGAIFYEMVTERKPFTGDDVDSVRQSILEGTPVAPLHVNSKVHPLLERSHHEGAGERSGATLPERQSNCSTIWRTAKRPGRRRLTNCSRQRRLQIRSRRTRLLQRSLRVPRGRRSRSKRKLRRRRRPACHLTQRKPRPPPPE